MLINYSKTEVARDMTVDRPFWLSDTCQHVVLLPISLYSDNTALRYCRNIIFDMASVCQLGFDNF